ncbi:helix-turn-helix transcriptional regulator [Acidovorax sp. FJL06]|uniref:helix-turn-helix domain-containing protein n=1 Tax=Acidovorax sp. FJL06 TaxID=2153365 RepID=UPI001F3FC3E9|nr:helix-turn-helix transcriptional regulator [Acidovorax sp. FJL06]
MVRESSGNEMPFGCSEWREWVSRTIALMNTFSNAFRAEVIRMARKELKPELQGMRKAITGHRSEIAALKREVKALTAQLKATQRQVKVADTPKAHAVAEEATSKKSRQIQFNAQALIEKRAALGVTQKQMAQLLGASSLSVYKWESGQVHPRAAQLKRIAEVLTLGKRKALALLHPQ